MRSLFSPGFIAEAAALICAVYFLNRQTGWRSFRWYLAAIVAVETTGWLLVHVLHFKWNPWPYNVLLLFFYPFLFLQLATAPGMERLYAYRWHINALCWLYYLLNALFVQPPGVFYSNVLLANSALLLLVCLFFFFSAVSNDRYDGLLKSEYFWLCAGLAFYAVSALLTNTFRATLVRLYHQTGFNFYRMVNDIFSNLLYPLLIIAFICRRKNQPLPST